MQTRMRFKILGIDKNNELIASRKPNLFIKLFIYIYIYKCIYILPSFLEINLRGLRTLRILKIFNIFILFPDNTYYNNFF